jgi:hypothetical protein
MAVLDFGWATGANAEATESEATRTAAIFMVMISLRGEVKV